MFYEAPALLTRPPTVTGRAGSEPRALWKQEPMISTALPCCLGDVVSWGTGMAQGHTFATLHSILEGKWQRWEAQSLGPSRLILAVSSAVRPAPPPGPPASRDNPPTALPGSRVGRCVELRRCMHAAPPRVLRGTARAASFLHLQRSASLSHSAPWYRLDVNVTSLCPLP